MKKQKGFTLIELLVVVAIIGILASVVLTSLGKARAKAKDAAIISELSGLRASAEIYATENNDSYDGFCDDPSVTDVTGKEGVVCGDSANEWAAYQPFGSPSGNIIGYCVDSSGQAKKVKTALGHGDTVCNSGSGAAGAGGAATS